MKPVFFKGKFNIVEASLNELFQFLRKQRITSITPRLPIVGDEKDLVANGGSHDSRSTLLSVPYTKLHAVDVFLFSSHLGPR